MGRILLVLGSTLRGRRSSVRFERRRRLYSVNNFILVFAERKGRQGMHMRTCISFKIQDFTFIALLTECTVQRLLLADVSFPQTASSLPTTRSIREV